MGNVPESQEQGKYPESQEPERGPESHIPGRRPGFISVILLAVAIVLFVVGITVGLEMIRTSGKIMQFNYKNKPASETSETRGAK